MTDRYMRLKVKGQGSPLKLRRTNESEDLLEDWYKPVNRSERDKRTYGPRYVDEKLALLREFNLKVHKKPEVLDEVRADLAAKEADEPEMSRFALRLNVIHEQMKNNKKLGMKSKYFKSPGIGIYEIFKGRLIIDSIFGDNLVTQEIDKYSREQGIIDTPAPIEISPPKKTLTRTEIMAALDKLKEENQELFARKNWRWDRLDDTTLRHYYEAVVNTVNREKKPKKTSSKKKSSKKKSAPKQKSQTQKLPRCPKGYHRNKKTGECEPKK